MKKILTFRDDIQDNISEIGKDFLRDCLAHKALKRIDSYSLERHKLF
jgi:hypothetical protein